jgi:hypothetical protein
MFDAQKQSLHDRLKLRRNKVNRRHRRRKLQLETLEDRRLLAIDIGVNFTGSTNDVDSPYIPPDTMADVGPNHIVELLNGTYSVYDKADGNELFGSSLDAFWVAAGASLNSDTFDPRVLYDADSDRWFAVSIGRGSGNRVYVGVSNSNDPLGGWKSVQFVGDTLNGTRFNDYPSMSVDADAITIGTNNFGAPTGFDVSLFAIPKADLLLATPTLVNMTRFEAQNFGALGGSLQAAISTEPSDNVTPVLGTFNSGTTIRRSSISNVPGGGASLSAATTITVPFYSRAPAGRQPGGATPLENVSPRQTGNVVEIGDYLWTTHSVRGSGSNAAVRWYQIQESTNTVVQTGLIENANLDFLDPSIGVSDLGMVAIGFTMTGPSTFPSAAVTVGYTVNGLGGPTTIFDPITVAQAGTSTYVRLGGGRNRWGDYSATSVDPSDASTFWTTQEWAAGNRWNTQITEVTLSDIDLNLSGNGLDNDIRIRESAPGVIEISIDGRVTTLPKSILNTLTISGGGGNDTLTVETASGNPFPIGGITFNGGADADDLVVDGGGTNIVYNATGPGAGNVDVDGNTITFTGLEPVTVSGTIANLTVNVNSGADHITDITDSGNAGTSLVTIDGGLESIEFVNPTVSLTVNGLSALNGHDFYLDGLDNGFTATVNINSGGGDDYVEINDTSNASAVNLNLGGGDDQAAVIGDVNDIGVVNISNPSGTADLLAANTNTSDTTWNISFPTGTTTRVAAGTTQINYTTAEISFAQIDGGSGDDLFNFDLTNGTTGHDVLVNGNGQNIGDSIVIGGASLDMVIHTFDNANDGNINLVDVARTIFYTGLEPITDNLDVVDRVFTFLQPALDAEFTQSATNPTTHTVLDSSVSESVEFTSPTSTLTVNLADGGTNILTATSFATDYSPTVARTDILGGDQVDIFNLESAPANNTGLDWRIFGNDGNDTLNVSPIGRNLDAFGDDIIFEGNAGNDTLNVFDNNFAGGRVIDITNDSVDAGPVFGVGDLSYLTTENLNIDAGSGNDTFNILSTQPGVDNNFRGWDGDDTFNIPDGSTLGSLVQIFGGNNDDRVNVTLTNVGGLASQVIFDGGSDDDRDSAVLTDRAGVARSIAVEYAGNPSGQTEVGGFGSLFIGLFNETILIDGDGPLDQLDVVGPTGIDDDITVAPFVDSALVFLGGSPWVGPSGGAFAANLPGVAGGGVSSDLLVNGIDDIDVIPRGGPPTNDRLFVYAPSEDNLVDGASGIDDFGFGTGVIIPGLGGGNAYDEVIVSDAQVSITNSSLGALVDVDVASPGNDFRQITPERVGIIVNTGFEANPQGNGIADFITVNPSTNVKLGVNGGDPLPAGAPNGDRLEITIPGELNIFSDKSTPPQVSVTSTTPAGTPVLGVEFSSIEFTLLRPNAANPEVNLLGDDNFTNQGQPDNFVVTGANADLNGADGGFQEFLLEINGSATINVDGVRFLNVIGGNEVDTLDITPYADNVPTGWGISVFYDEQDPVDDGTQQDLLIYNTAVFGGNVSERIVIAPSGEQHGEIRVTNGSFGTPIVNISYVNNLDIIVNDNDSSQSDSDTLTLLGTNNDNPTTSGREDFDINFGAAGDVANPVVTVTNVASGNALYRLRSVSNITAVSFDGLSGVDRFDVTAAANVTVNVHGGNPSGNSGTNDVLNVITGVNTIAHTAGGQADEGKFQIGGGAAPINFDEIEWLQANGVSYIAADAWEANNTVATASFLGSVPEITLNNLTLHGTDGTANGFTSADVDIYEWVANKTGLATVTIDFTHANGDLRLQVLDAANNLVTPLLDTVNDDETLTFPVVAGQSYFVAVNSATNASNDYSLEVENYGVPSPASIDLQPANDTGTYDTDDITFDNVGTIEIQADLEAYRNANVTILTAAQAAAGVTAGVAVRVMVNGSEVGFATPTSPTGQTDDLFRYTFTAGDLPADDVFEIEAAVYVVDGQAAHASGRALTGKVLLLEIDQTAPVAGSIQLAPYSDSGVLGDNITNKMSPAFIGVGEANAIVRVIGARTLQAAPHNAPTILGVGVVGSDLTDGILGNGLGLWEITAEPMVNDVYQITYTMEDIAGNITAGPVGGFNLTIDGLPPQRPTLDLVGPDVVDSMPSNAVGNPLTPPLYSDTGISTSDNVTMGTTPGGATSTVQVRVSAEVGQTVVIKDGEQIIETFTMPNSEFVFVNLALDEDPHPLSAEVFDVAGNRSHQSEKLHVTMDYTAPNVATSTIDLATANDSFGPDAGAIGNSTDNITNDDTPLFVGLAEANSKVRVFANGELVGQTVVNSDESDGDAPQGLSLGTWEVETASLNDGNYAITFEVEDAAGNISTSAATLNITVDTLPPQRPTIDLHNADDTGASDLDNVTAGDPTATGRIVDYRISAQQGSWVQVKDGETIITSFVFTAAFDTLDGQADGYGNITVDFDTLAGANNIPAEGPHMISIEAFDVPGNRSAQAEQLVTEIDTTAPATPAAPDLDADSDSGFFDNDNVTNVDTPTFSGLGEANSLVRLWATNVNTSEVQQIGEGRVGSDESDGTDTNGSGVWTVESSAMDEGVYNITATFEDLAGNISTATPALQVEIDTIQPNTAFLDLREADDSGRHNDDNITNVTSPVFTGTTEDPNNALHILPANLAFRIFDRPEGGTETLIYDSNAVLPGLTANTLITTAGLPLAEGYHNLKLEVEDRAGNISSDFLLTVVIDETAPPVSIIGLLDSDSGVSGNQATLTDRVTNRTDAQFVGRAEADAIVRLYVDGREGVNNDNNVINTPGEFSLTMSQPLDGDDAFANGQWETTFIRDLNDGNYFDLDGVREILVTAEDVAGNVSSASVLDIFIDTAGPQVTSVQIPSAPTYDLFDPKPATDGPTPLTNQLSISVRDWPARSAQDGNFLYSALYATTAQNPGNYSLVGDANGNIGIQSVVFTANPAADNTVASGTITITFADFLPDDRFTFTVSDALLDPAGNALDGETNTVGPLAVPTFPSGDGQAGGDFVARFTVDSRPEIGNWAGGTIWIDTNGNGSFDPTNEDSTNRDITYVMGLVTDDIFAGNFALGAADTADGFDKLAAYGFVNGSFRWLVDTDNDGVVNVDLSDPTAVNGLPVAGRFDNNDVNGDEVGLFTGTAWHFDTNHDFVVDMTLTTAQRGLPIVGDFDGDGFDDLGTWTDDTFQIDYAAGVRRGWDGVVDAEFRFGFIGTRERPVAADMNMDGFDDLGLWVPDREGQTPREGGEFYFLVSNGAPVASRIRFDANLNTNVVDFHPTPFGNDFFVQYGDDYSMPVVGNFDPPVTSNSGSIVGLLNFNTSNPYDVNADGRVNAGDIIDLVVYVHQNGTGHLPTGRTEPLWVDVNQDGHLRFSDIAALLQAVLREYGGAPEPVTNSDVTPIIASFDQFFADLEEDDLPIFLDLN